MKEDEIFLLEKAKENLRAAELLVQQGFHDIAASRVYFVMFYLGSVASETRLVVFQPFGGNCCIW